MENAVPPGLAVSGIGQNGQVGGIKVIQQRIILIIHLRDEAGLETDGIGEVHFTLGQIHGLSIFFVGKLILHLNKGSGGDEVSLGEADASLGIIDGIVIPPLHLFAIQKNGFGAGHHLQSTGNILRQVVGSLLRLHSGNGGGSLFPFGYGYCASVTVCAEP